MADIESNINLDIDASGAIASLKELQRQISVFQTTMAKTGAVSNARLSDMQNNLVNSINATGQFTASIQKVKTTTESFTTALEKNKLSMGQYFKYSMGATRTFGKGFKTEFDTIEKVARERVKTLQTQYIKLGRDASGAMQAIAVRPQVLDMKDLGTQTAIAAQKAQLFNQLMQQGSTNLLNFGKNTQWAGRQLMVGFTIPLGIMGAAAAKEFKAIEEQVIRLERVYGDFTTTMADTEQITQQIKDLGSEFTKYGVAVSKTIGLAADAAAMGKTGAALVAQVAEANRLAVLGGVDQQQSLETTISLTNSFGIAADQLSSKINFLNAVENQTVTSIEDLTEAIPKAGPVVQQLGGNVEDLTFFLTAMKEGGINASEGANALKSGLASLINPTGEAVDMLAGFGVNLQGIVEANKGNVKGIVIDFAKALDTLDPLNRAQAIEQLFGKFQFSRLSTLFQNVIAEGSQASRVLDLTKASATELAALSERELGRIEASPLFKYQAAIENFKAAIAPVGEEFMKAVTPLINFGTQILEGFNSWSDGAKQFAVIATGAIGAIGPVLLMTFGLLANGLANIVKGVLFMRNGFKGAGAQSNVLTEQLSYMNTEQLEAASISASLNQVHNNLIQTFTSEAGAVRNLAGAYAQAISVQNGFMGPITTRGGGMKSPKKFASGGIISGPGTGTSDSILSLVSNGEAIIPAAAVKKNPGLVSGLINGNLPRFKDGFAPDSLIKGYGNATLFMPESMNTTAGGTGKGLATGDLVNYFKSAGSAAAGPLLAVMAREMGVKLNDPANLEEWKAVGDKFMTAASDALVKSGKEFVKDADIEEAVVPALREAARGVNVAGKDIATSLDNAIDQIRTVGQVGTQSGTAAGMGRTSLPGSYRTARVQAQTFASNANPSMFAVQSRTSSTTGKTIRAFRTQNTATGDWESATMAHITRSITASVETIKKKTAPYLGDVSARLVKAIGGNIVKGVKTSTRQASPSKEAFNAGENIGKGAIQGIQSTADDATRAGSAFVRKIDSARTQAGASRRVSTGEFTALPGGYLQQKLAEQKKQERLEKRQERMAKLKSAMSPGRLGMAGMVAGGAMSAMSGMGGPMGDVAGALGGPMMAISGLTSVMSMIPGPAGIAVAAIGGLAAGIMYLNAESEKAKQAIRDQAASVSSGTKAMQAFAEAAGTMSPSDIANQRRTEATRTGQAEATFGESYLASETGAAMLKGVRGFVDSNGMAEASQKIANQLSTAVAAGILSAEQADSIAMALGDQLQSDTFAINIMGNMDKLIGPNGEEIGKDPIKVAIQISQAGQRELNNYLDEIDQISNNPVATGYGLSNTTMSQGPTNVSGYAPGRGAGYVGGAQTNSIIAKAPEIVAAFTSMQQQNQLMLDTQDQANAKAVQQLMTEGKIAEAQQLQNTYLTQRKTLMDQTSASTQAFLDKMKGMDQQARNALVNEAGTAAKAVYAGTAQESAANKAVGTLTGGRASAEAKVVLSTELAAGALTPEQMNSIFKLFDQSTVEGGRAVNLLASINTEMGAGMTADVANLLPMFGNNEVAAKNFLATFDVDNPEKFQESVGLFQKLQMGNPELDLSVYFDGSDAAIERMNLLMDATEKLKAMAAEGPITMQSVISQIFDSDPSAAAALMANNEYFASLPEEQKTAYIQYFITARDDVSAKEVSKYLSDNKINLKGRSADSAERAVSSAANAVAANKAKGFTQQYGSFMNLGSTSGRGGSSGGGSTPSGGGGGGAAAEPQKPPTSFLDSIVKDIRDFSNAAQTLTENFQDSMNAIRSSSANIFNGLSQQMRNLGAGEDIIQLMTSMSKEDWDQYKGQFFNFDAAGNITSLKSDLAVIQEKVRALSMAKFVNEQQKSIAASRDQALALSKLASLGMKYADAYRVVEDAALAAAIANAKSAEEIRQIIALANQARQAQTLAQSSASVAGTNAATDATTAGLNALIRFNGALSDTQIAAVLASDDLQNMLANFDTLSTDQLKILNEALQDAADKEALEIKIKMQTKEGMQELFNEGLNKAMEQFSAREQEIKIKFKALRDPFQDIIDSFTQQVEDMRNQPGGLDDLEADLQRIGDQEVDINKKYEERYKALDSISKINERVAAQQRTQLSLAEALSMGDIAAAARAAEEMRAQDAAQALVDQRESLQKSQELELANITANMGLTREQIEARIRDINKQIFEIQEKQIEPAQYQLELLGRQEEVQINALEVAGKTKEEWETIKNNIDLARTNSQQYNEAINLALGVVQDLQNAWKEIEKPKQTIHTIIEKRISDAEAAAAAAAARPATPAPVASTAPAPSGPVKDDAWVTSMARRVIRGEFGNGQARRNALGGDYQTIQDRVNRILYQGYASGGLVASYMASGGLTKPMFGPKGTDTVPAMLTPGEFVVKKWAVDRFGVGNLNAINQGKFGGGSVYNYNMSVNVRSDANPDEIARTVMAQIKRVDAQRIRGNRF